MSSDLTISPCSSNSRTNDYTSQIDEIFNQRWNALESARQTAVKKIDEWCHELGQGIKKYADKQKTRINDQYDRLRPVFDEKRIANLETANAYHAARQDDLFKELHNACQLLIFQVATLEFAKCEIEQPKVVIIEEPMKTNSDETMSEARRRRRLNNKDTNGTENVTTASARSSPKSTASNENEMDNQHVTEKKPTNKTNQRRSNMDDSKNQGTNVSRSDNKCPICFMIFPLSMTSGDRQQHANEHYTDG